MAKEQTPAEKTDEEQETAAWAEFDQIDQAAAGKAAAAPAIDGSPVVEAFEKASGAVQPEKQPAVPPLSADASKGAAPAADKTVPPAAAATPEGEQPFADLPEDVRKRVFESWEKETAALRGRVGPVQRQNEELRRENARLKAQPAAPTTAKPKELVLPGDPGWDKFKKDYPEFAGPLETRLNQALKAVDEHVGATIGKPLKDIGGRIAKTEEERALEREASALAANHPDFFDIKESQEFDDWLSTLPEHVAALVDSPKSADADWLLTQYKASTFYKPPAGPAPGAGNPPAPAANGGGAKPQSAQTPLDAKRQRQLQGARTPSGGRATPAAAVTTIPDDPQGAWDAFEKMGL